MRIIVYGAGGRGSEVALLGREHGVPTPVNELLQQVANRMARERQAPAR